MATITKTAIKVSTAIAAASNSGGTLYTCPASSYAILNISVYSDTACRVTVGGSTVIAGDTTGVGSTAFKTDTNRRSFTVYVGPGQAVAWTESGTSGIDVSGVEFVNN